MNRTTWIANGLLIEFDINFDIAYPSFDWSGITMLWSQAGLLFIYARKHRKYTFVRLYICAFIQFVPTWSTICTSLTHFFHLYIYNMNNSIPWPSTIQKNTWRLLKPIQSNQKQYFLSLSRVCLNEKFANFKLNMHKNRTK